MEQGLGWVTIEPIVCGYYGVENAYSMQDTQPSTSVPSSAIWRSRM
jgi:hypothetical protein